MKSAEAARTIRDARRDRGGGACRAYRRQIALIDQLFRLRGAMPDGDLAISEGLGAAGRERIKLRLRARPDR